MQIPLLPSLLLLAACVDKDDDSGGSGSTVPTPLSACAAYDSGSAIVEALAISADTLSVDVGYGGGCEDHQFSVCWPDQAFAESDPVQVSLALWHEANGDTCEAWLSTTLEIDLTTIKDQYLSGYGGTGGTVVLHLGDQSATYGF